MVSSTFGNNNERKKRKLGEKKRRECQRNEKLSKMDDDDSVGKSKLSIRFQWMWFCIIHRFAHSFTVNHWSFVEMAK